MVSNPGYIVSVDSDGNVSGEMPSIGPTVVHEDDALYENIEPPATMEDSSIRLLSRGKLTPPEVAEKGAVGWKACMMTASSQFVY